MKFASVVALALLESSQAFMAPVARSSSSQITMGAKKAAAVGFENEVGALPPTGFWDPLKLTEGIDQETFDQYRTAELKHGRVAQLCVVGYVVPEIYRFPGNIAPGLPFADLPSGIAAIDAIPATGWIQMVFFIGAVDYWGFLGDFEAGKKDLSPELLATRQTQELQHGRLAMLASLELLRHDAQNLVSPGFDGFDDLITGLPFLYGDGYSAL